jgi:hypothetical protein
MLLLVAQRWICIASPEMPSDPPDHIQIATGWDPARHCRRLVYSHFFALS